MNTVEWLCPQCDGSGILRSPDEVERECRHCNGRGHFLIDEEDQPTDTCKSCSGWGVKLWSNEKCGNCEGLGKVWEEGFYERRK